MVEIKPLVDFDALRRLGIEAGLDAGDDRDEDIRVAWGAHVADDLVGGVALEYLADLYLVTWLSVRSDSRGKGIGRQLLRAVEAEAARRSASDLWATARAPGFFMRAGYTVAGGGPERELLLPACNDCEQYLDTCHPKIVKKAITPQREAVEGGKWGDRG
jgi:N-acetylglutamate synthase-like GNAT family acetyltransferase